MLSNRRFNEERAELVTALAARGISDTRVLKAVGEVPRHEFVDELWLARAYEDSALPIGCSQTISQPFTVAFMTQLLDVRRGDKVLEIGTGSGYQAAILSMMGARVFTIERHFALLESARKLFDSLRYTIASKVGDGTVGWSDFAPFDRIIVTAGGPDVPQSLLKQLGDGGILVIPVGDQSGQTMLRAEKNHGKITYSSYKGFKFVPLLGKEGW